MTQRCAFLLAMLAATVLSIQAATAAPVTFDLIAEVTTVSDSSQFRCATTSLLPCRTGEAGMISGDQFAISYTFDSEAGGVPYGDGFVRYVFAGAPFEIDISINDEIQFDSFEIAVRNDGLFVTPDEYRVSAGIFSAYTSSFYLELGATDASALASDDLPLEPPSLDSLAFARGLLTIPRTPPNPNQVSALEFRVVRISATVPEPASALLSLLALAAISCSRACYMELR